MSVELEKSEPVYELIRFFFLREKKFSAKEVQEVVGVSDVENTLEDLVASSLMERDEEKFYVSQEVLSSKWVALWTEELDQDISLGEERRELLTNFLKKYTSRVESSTVEKMLVHDFFQGLRILCSEGYPHDWAKVLLKTLEQNYSYSQDLGKIMDDSYSDVVR